MGGDGRTAESAWTPLSHRVFRALWIASLVSNIGTWMQNVSAAWAMTSLSPSPLMVALVQSATSLPVFVVGLPAGAVADIVDRRRLLLVTQCWMLVAAGLLAVLAFLGLMTATTLLALTFALGIGVAMNTPTWQAITSELVPPSELTRAVTLIDNLLNNAYNCPVPHYRSRHETIWFGQAVGEATTAGHCPVANGHIISRRCPGGGGSVEFGGALEASLSAQRPDGVTQSADSRAAASLDEGPAGAPPLAAPAWGARRRAHNGVVDPPTHCHADRGPVRCSLQCRRRVEAVAARPRVELAETRTPRSPAGRRGHRTMEAADVAPYKKTPPGVGPISCFSMKAAFC